MSNAVVTKKMLRSSRMRNESWFVGGHRVYKNKNKYLSKVEKLGIIKRMIRKVKSAIRSRLPKKDGEL